MNYDRPRHAARPSYLGGYSDFKVQDALQAAIRLCLSTSSSASTQQRAFNDFAAALRAAFERQSPLSARRETYVRTYYVRTYVESYSPVLSPFWSRRELEPVQMQPLIFGILSVKRVN